MNSLISARQLTPEFLGEFFRIADGMVESLSRHGASLGAGHILGTMFFEPSTRTRLSFESAMQRLGGTSLGFAEPKSSSASKGESLADTIRVVSGYADALVMRHFTDGAARLAADFTSVPFINAGDGRHEHPTQTLTDLLTLHRLGLYGQDMKIGAVGDLKYGRTVHSLVKALFDTGATIYSAAPETLRLPAELVEEAQAKGLNIVDCDSLEELLPQVSVVYMTRIQKERLDEGEDYQALAGRYVLTRELVEQHNPEACVLHPLPRVDELAYSVDDLPTAKYFEQAHMGVPARMALLAMLLGLVRWRQESLPTPRELHGERPASSGERCANTRCVINCEVFAPPLVWADGAGKLRCSYCDQELD